jgi:hypothetical protein
VALSVVCVVYHFKFPLATVWSVVKLELWLVVELCVVNVVYSCFVSYLFVNCGFGNDESLQMTIGSHGKD